MTKLILDVDTGTDDAIAIMLAALDPRLELVGGDDGRRQPSIEHTTDNTCAYSTTSAATCPSTAGLPGRSFRRRRWTSDRRAEREDPRRHLDLPAARSQPQQPGRPVPRRDFDEAPRSVLVPRASTNVATALLLEPRPRSSGSPRRARSAAATARERDPVGGVQHRADPEAAASSCARDPRPYDRAARRDPQALVSERGLRPARRARHAGRNRGRDIIRTGSRLQASSRRPSTARLRPRRLCVAHLIDPAVIELREAHVDVELDGELTRSHTVADLRPSPGGRPTSWLNGSSANAAVIPQTLDRPTDKNRTPVRSVLWRRDFRARPPALPGRLCDRSRLLLPPQLGLHSHLVLVGRADEGDEIDGLPQRRLAGDTWTSSPAVT